MMKCMGGSQGGNYLKPKDSVHSTEADNTLDKTNHGERERESVGQLYFERELWGEEEVPSFFCFGFGFGSPRLILRGCFVYPSS
jgi:hypothetical protein